jgi:hypothetical protein
VGVPSTYGPSVTVRAVSPTASIFHGIAVGILLALLRAFGWAWEADALLVGVLLLIPPLGIAGRQARRGSPGGPPPVPRNERIRIGAAIIAVVVPSLLVAAVPRATGYLDVRSGGHDAVVLAMVLIAIVSAELVFMSGLLDWFYVRPHLRGGLGTVCATSLDARWRNVTRVWLLHRAAATLGAIASITALVTLTANSWIRPLDETVAGAIAAVATIIAGYYITRTAPLLAIAINPPVQVGDVIEIAEEFNVREPDRLREYFVVDVALEGVKLLLVSKEGRVRREGRDAHRTHDRTVDVTDIAKLLRGRRPIQPCPGECQKLTEYCECDSPWVPPVTDRVSREGGSD